MICNNYIVRFQDCDGSKISESYYHSGSVIDIPADPAKAADNIYTYTFTGWDKEVVLCTGDATYTATYAQTYIDYTVTFVGADGTVLSTNTYHWGEEVTVPVAPDAEDGYVFKGWNPEVTACAGNAVYTAVYGPVHKPGDIDKDEVITTEDVIQLLLHVTMPDMFPIDAEADLDGDGMTTTEDVIKLLLHVTMPDMFPL